MGSCRGWKSHQRVLGWSTGHHVSQHLGKFLRSCDSWDAALESIRVVISRSVEKAGRAVNLAVELTAVDFYTNRDDIPKGISAGLIRGITPMSCEVGWSNDLKESFQTVVRLCA